MAVKTRSRVTVMDVRDVGMVVLERGMRVRVRVRLSGRIVRAVTVLVMLVVHMPMVVRHRLVGMKMAVPLS